MSNTSPATVDCEALWKRFTTGREPKLNKDSGSTSNGSHRGGYGFELEIWYFDEDGFTIRATRMKMSSFCPSFEDLKHDRAIEIMKDKAVVFSASKAEGGQRKNFGVDERYLGIEDYAVEPWKIRSGAVPELFLRPAA